MKFTAARDHTAHAPTCPLADPTPLCCEPRCAALPTLLLDRRWHRLHIHLRFAVQRRKLHRQAHRARPAQHGGCYAEPGCGASGVWLKLQPGEVWWAGLQQSPPRNSFACRCPPVRRPTAGPTPTAASSSSLWAPPTGWVSSDVPPVRPPACTCPMRCLPIQHLMGTTALRPPACLQTTSTWCLGGCWATACCRCASWRRCRRGPTTGQSCPASFPSAASCEF